MNEEGLAGCSDISLADGQFSATRSSLVRPMDIGEQHPASSKAELQETPRTVKNPESYKVVFESYLASKTTHGKVAGVMNKSASTAPSTHRFSVPSKLTAEPQVPGEQQQNQMSLLNVARPSSSVPRAGLPVSGHKVRSVVRGARSETAAAQTSVSATDGVTSVGHGQVTPSHIVLPNSNQLGVVQIGNTLVRIPLPANAQAKNKTRLLNSPKSSSLQLVSSPSKGNRTPSIISRSRTLKKSPQQSNSSHAVSLTTGAQSSATVFTTPVIQVAMTLATSAASPKISSSLLSSLVASSSNVVIPNSLASNSSPAAAAPAALSSFNMDVGNSGRIIRLAGARNISLTPLGTIALPSASPKLAAGGLRFSSSRASTSSAPVHRYILTSPNTTGSSALQLVTGAGNAAAAGKSFSPLTSFRMQSIRHQQSSSAPLSVAIVNPPTQREPEKLLLKRVASWSGDAAPSEEQPKKRRKFVPGKAYRVTLMGEQKKCVGFWENNMVRNLAYQPVLSKAEVTDAEKDAVRSMLSKDGNCNSKVGRGCSQQLTFVSSSLDARAETEESADAAKERFYICMKCRTLTSSNVPCVTCSIMPLACSVIPQPSLLKSIPDSPSKPSAAAESPSQTQMVDVALPSPVALPEAAAPAMPQVESNAAQLKPLQRLFVMQSSGTTSKQIQVTRLPHEQTTTFQLNLPVRLQCGSASLSSANARAAAAAAGQKLFRKKVLETQKRSEPDVVQILSSDDEDCQSAERGTRAGLAAAASLATAATLMSAPAAQPQKSTEEGGQKSQSAETQPVNKSDTPSAPRAPSVARNENLEFTIKIRIVRFGTLQKSSVVECSFYVDGIKIVFSKDEVIGSCSLYIPAIDLRVIRVHYGPCGPVLFLQVYAGVAARLREILPFHDHSFDPDHKDDACRYITIIPDKNQVMDEKFVSATFEKMQANCPASRRFVVQTINGDVASQLLKAKVSAPSSTQLLTGATPAQTVIFITVNGQVIQRQVVPGELAARPTEGDEEEEVADKSRSPSPPRPTFIGPIMKLFTYPPPPATGGIAVTNEDFFCLKDGEFLNDVIIDFYLKYLLREVLSKYDRDRTHVFSSFFYRRLMQKQAKEQKDSTMTLQQLRHSRVRTWTRHVDLFSKDFIIVPINESAHWYLAIMCYPGLGGTVSSGQNLIPSTEQAGKEAENSKASNDSQNTEADSKNSVDKKPCILIFDSLAMPTRYGVVRTLREYLQSEWDAKRKAKEGPRNFNKDSMQGACPRCPRQTNFSDCGVYVLQYVESFFKDPIRSFSLPITTLATWFSEDVVVSKRELLRQLVLRLQKGLNPDLEYDPCQNSVDSLTSGTTLQIMSSPSSTSGVEATTNESAENVIPAPITHKEQFASDQWTNGHTIDQLSAAVEDNSVATDAAISHPDNDSERCLPVSSVGLNSLVSETDIAVAASAAGETAVDVSVKNQDDDDAQDAVFQEQETNFNPEEMSSSFMIASHLSELQISEQTAVPLTDDALNMSASEKKLCKQETGYSSAFSSWLSQHPRSSTSDDIAQDESQHLASPADQLFPSEDGELENGKTTSHDNQMEVDSNNLTGTASSYVCLNSANVALREANANDLRKETSWEEEQTIIDSHADITDRQHAANETTLVNDIASS